MEWWNSSYRNCHCAFCRKPRRVYVKRHLSWTDVVLTAIGAVTVCALVWQRLEPRAALIFVAMLMLGETAVQIRWRVGLACSGCGFDPLLYMRRPDAARERVRAFFDRRRDEPDFLLTAHSLIETQRRHQSREQKLRKKFPTLNVSGELVAPKKKSISRTI